MVDFTASYVRLPECIFRGHVGFRECNLGNFGHPGRNSSTKKYLQSQFVTKIAWAFEQLKNKNVFTTMILEANRFRLWTCWGLDV